MAEEAKARGSGDNRGRRRRYFKRKSSDKTQEGSAPATATSESASKPAAAAPQGGKTRHGRDRGASGQPRKEGGSGGSSGGAQAALEGGRARGVRKRRRSKSRRGGDGRGAEGRVETQSAGMQEPDYIAPSNVYIYTHVVRPGRDNYEFRADHFSGVGHSLQDYSIDISELFDKPKVSYGANFARFYAELEDGVQSGIVDPRFPPEPEPVAPNELAQSESATPGSPVQPASEAPVLDTTSVQDYVPDDAHGDSTSEAHGALDDLTAPHFAPPAETQSDESADQAPDTEETNGQE